MSHTADPEPEDIGSAHEHIPDQRSRRDDGRHSLGDDAPGVPGRVAGRDAPKKREPPTTGQESLPLDLEGLRPEVAERVQEVVELALTQHVQWSAPMPQPGVLREYDEVLPGSAERILRAFESVTVDASARDDRITDVSIWVRKNGAGWAFFLLFVCVVASIVFFARGDTVAGGTLIGAPVVLGLVSMLTSFGKRQRDSD